MKILGIDKDGTLIQTKSGKKYVDLPGDQEPIAGAVKALEHWVGDGWKPVIISNQDGGRYGHQNIETVFSAMQFCLDLFQLINDVYFCPDAEGVICWRSWGDCDPDQRIQYNSQDIEFYSGFFNQPEKEWNFRKPSPGMIHLVQGVEESTDFVYVGDKNEDLLAAAAAGVRFLWASDWRGIYGNP